MRIAPVLFKREIQDGIKVMFKEVNQDAIWVVNGEGNGYLKYDGHPCRIHRGKIFQRCERQLSEIGLSKHQFGHQRLTAHDYLPAPKGWIAAQPEPHQLSGRWPGWLHVADSYENQE